MNEIQPTEGEGNQPPPEPNPQLTPAEEKGKNNNPQSPIGTNETDAITAAGVIAGRGPGSTMEFQPKRISLSRGVASLRHRDFRLYWLSQLISLIGTWMQILAQGWLVLEISGSALDLGVVSALQFLPALVLSIFGGLLADMFPKRYLILGTQTASMLLAFALSALTWLGVVNIAHVMILAFLLGLVNAVDMPTRQAYVVELVGREDLPNAVALNSSAFNAARLAGPAIGGLAIGWLGLALVFFLNGVSFLPVIAALLAIKAGTRAVAHGIRAGSILVHVREGLSYVRHTKLVLLTVVLIAVVGTFGMNFGVIAPLFAKDVLDVGADGYGLLMSAMGLGSLAASVMLAFFPWQPHQRLLIGGAAVFGVLEVILAQTTDFVVSLYLLGAIGFSMIFLTTVANTTLQAVTPDHLRGRVMSVYTTVFVGTTPLGSLFTGALAHLSGVALPLLVGGLISVGAALVTWVQEIGNGSSFVSRDSRSP